METPSNTSAGHWITVYESILFVGQVIGGQEEFKSLRGTVGKLGRENGKPSFIHGLAVSGGVIVEILLFFVSRVKAAEKQARDLIIKYGDKEQTSRFNEGSLM